MITILVSDDHMRAFATQPDTHATPITRLQDPIYIHFKTPFAREHDSWAIVFTTTHALAVYGSIALAPT